MTDRVSTDEIERMIREGEITPPDIAELEEWSFDGVAEATDGCQVEPDGVCPHGHQSWLLFYGLI